MSLRSLFETLGRERGIELSVADLELLGDAEEIEMDEILAEPLPGRAAGQVELFLGDTGLADFEGLADEKSDLLWYPIIREGQWAVRPGTTGSKKRRPLKVVAGTSANQRKEIGLQDLLSAFDDQAVEYVTVPSSHNNTVLENQGFIKGMKIVDGTIKDKKTKKDMKVKVLLGGYDITEPDTKGKVQRGTIASRSAGILYDYVNTETGKSYPAVVEHVALTNKPWITGMVSFGRKLREGSADPLAVPTVALSLSDDGPGDDEYALSLSEELDLSDDDRDFLAVAGATWDHETSPSWLRQQTDKVLRDARSKKMQAKRLAQPSGASLYVEDYVPCYRCVEAKPGQALISDDYGDDANFWVAPISVKDGVVELSDFETWTASKKAYVPDDRPAPEKDKLPLSEREEAAEEQPKSRLQLAQERRRKRATPAQDEPTKPREVVDNKMADTTTLELSEDAQRLIQAAEARAKAAEEQATQLAQKVERLTGTVQSGEVDTYVKLLSSDEDGGLGLSEERGFGGVLVEIRELMLADDGELAVQSDHFSTDGNKSGELTFTEGLKRVFTALSKSNEGKKKLGELLSQPADGEHLADIKCPECSDTFSSKDAASKHMKDKHPDSKLSVETAVTETGKPSAGDETEGEKLSAEERVSLMAAANPAMASLIGGVPAPKKEGDK